MQGGRRTETDTVNSSTIRSFHAQKKFAKCISPRREPFILCLFFQLLGWSGLLLYFVAVTEKQQCALQIGVCKTTCSRV